MSQFYVPGPSIIQVSTGTSGALQFVGFNEQRTRISVGAKFKDVFTDYAGEMLPADCSFQGIDAYIMMDLSQFNEAIVSKIAARLNGTGVVEGAIGANAIGTMMLQEGFYYRVLIQSAYAGKTGYSTMIPAYNFLTCIPVDNYDVSLNATPKVPRLVFRAITKISPTNLTGTLYNNDVTGAVSAN